MTFTETQRFRQPIIWLILFIAGVIPVSIFAYGIYQQILLGNQFGNRPMSNALLIFMFVITFILFFSLCFLFGMIKLATIIDEAGIRYKMFPIHLKYRNLTWDMIESFEVIKYNPIQDYGGWGIRFGKKGRAYNISGDKGLYLVLKTGKALLIGTQKETELKNFLGSLKK